MQLKNSAHDDADTVPRCPWSDLVLEGKTTEQHYFDWFSGKTAGGTPSMHIDPRTPNGGGVLSGPKFKMCRAFPEID